MSFEESPWEREDREIHEAFRAKDAEIERLNWKLEKAGMIIFECGLDWLEKKKLFNELADALEEQSCWSTRVELIQRAREASNATRR